MSHFSASIKIQSDFRPLSLDAQLTGLMEAVILWCTTFPTFKGCVTFKWHKINHKMINIFTCWAIILILLFLEYMLHESVISHTQKVIYQNYICYINIPLYHVIGQRHLKGKKGIAPHKLLFNGWALKLLFIWWELFYKSSSVSLFSNDM